MVVQDFQIEISFKTARSGGKGGQHVNKVETMVEGYWQVSASSFFSEKEKERLLQILAPKINSNGFLLVKSQVHRTQLANKEEVIKKINRLVRQALMVPKKRKPTKISRAVKAKRIESKKKTAEKKSQRRKTDW